MKRLIFMAFLTLLSFNASAYWTKHPYGISSGWVGSYSGTCAEYIATKPRKTMEGLTDYTLISRAEANATYENDYRYGPQLWCNYKYLLWRGPACPNKLAPAYPSTECEPVNLCESVAGSTVEVGWFSEVYGQSPGHYWCTTKGGGCVGTYAKSSGFCSNSVDAGEYDCIATYEVTSTECTPSESGDSWCTDASCSSHQSGTSDPITPDHNPADPTTPVTPPSSGGSSGGSSGPVSPDGVQDLPVEDATDATDAVKKMNQDMNTLIRDFNEDVNKSSVVLQGQVITLSDGILEALKNDIKIHENEKLLINQLNADVTTAVNKSTNHADKGFDTLGKKLDGIKAAIEGAPSGGGGGSGTDPNALAALQEIRCLLDEECESDSKQKPTATVNCKSSKFECKGDVIQCAQLKLDYENSCVTKELNDLEKALQGISNVDNVAMLVDAENEMDFSKLDTKYLESGVSFGAASCPAPARITLDIPYVGSYVIDFSYEPACKWAEIMNPLVHLAGWIFGLYIIFRAQGSV
ncbi:virulence factor TspB C-terminal domain-related protein [Vibrio sinaloensis]|uniref:virulence factor TspB C-terminal domain-related protein n=1 Tax=Photobacterium sp. (strain ATCC 43367) TaxID=379097 RepID=UPI00057D67AC|nr:virulence factor TspB C-terminal domain-related protein [Vibrio sinaloensis]KHT38046.1 hypothetical protein RJ46_18770 [Vibrio sinaloensis]